MFKRLTILLYGVVSYVIFFATFLYSIGFVGNLFVPRSIDSEPVGSLAYAILINLAVLTVFAVQHSVMARSGFKRWWTRIVPVEAERSTYVLFSSLALILLFALWQPLGVWSGRCRILRFKPCYMWVLAAAGRWCWSPPS